MTVSGTPAHTRIDKTVNFNWWWERWLKYLPWMKPAPGVRPTHFSVRWTGEVMAPTTGTYNFYTESDDGVRVWVNGQEIINNWTDHAAKLNSGSINLVAGQKYSIKMEYYQDKGLAVAKLGWIKPNATSQSIIPKVDLYSQ